jgi:hypothetical protein
VASIIPNSLFFDLAKSNFDFDAITAKCMLLTSGYTPNKDHNRRDDLTNEVVGSGYTEGGAAAVVSVTQDDTNDRIDLGLGAVTWNPATITARYAAYYNARGGAASADELVAVIDFGGDITSTAGPFDLTASTIRIAQP